jgi:hypothetical protein
MRPNHFARCTAGAPCEHTDVGVVDRLDVTQRMLLAPVETVHRSCKKVNLADQRPLLYRKWVFPPAALKPAAAPPPWTVSATYGRPMRSILISISPSPLRASPLCPACSASQFNACRLPIESSRKYEPAPSSAPTAATTMSSMALLHGSPRDPGTSFAHTE